MSSRDAHQTARTADTRAPRPVRRRETTRSHLVAAAAELFAERGSTAVSVEAVCERAGYTRGAFYSSFKTVDDLFFALYEQRNTEVQERLEELTPAAPAPGGAAPTRGSVEAGVAAALRVLPSDPQWLAVQTSFTWQAQHRPEVAAALKEHSEAFLARLQPLLLRGLELTGRRLLTTPETYTRAVLAAHVGATVQSPLHDDPAAVVEATVRGVILGLTTPDPT